MSKNKYGNVYEIKLSTCKYVYVCWIEDLSFGIFNYVSEQPTNVEHLLTAGFKAYQGCNEKAVKKNIWKLIGCIDLEKENIQLPDLVIFQDWNKALCIEEPKAMRHGNLIRIETDEYVSLLKKDISMVFSMII